VQEVQPSGSLVISRVKEGTDGTSQPQLAVESAGMDSSRRWGNSPCTTPQRQLTKRPRVFLHRNDGLIEDQPPSTLVYTLSALLEDAYQLLGLAKAARRIFTVTGEEISSVHQLANMMELVVTTGANFSPYAARWPNPEECPVVHLHRNDGGLGSGEPMASTQVVTVGMLLLAAQRGLSLSKRCKRVFLLNGVYEEEANEVKTITQLYHQCHVAISCGEPFKPRSGVVPSNRSSSRASSLRSRSPRHDVGYSRDAGYSRNSRLPQSRPQTAQGTIRVNSLGLPCKEDPITQRPPRERSVSRQRTPRDSRQRTPRGEMSHKENSNKKWPANVSRPKVIMYKNDGGASTRCVATLVHSLGNLLEDATLNLELPRAAQRLFQMDGSEVRTVECLRNHIELVVSMGEEFRLRRTTNPRTQQTR